MVQITSYISICVCLSVVLNTLAVSAGSMHDIEPVFNITDIFIPSGYMGDLDAIKILDRYNENLSPDKTPNSCIQISYFPNNTIRDNKWAGVYWLYPENNWGNLPGYNLSGYTILTFRARGEKGGEEVEFKFGGINSKGKRYSDSEVPAITTGIIKLSPQWENYSIDLTSGNLSSVLGGFCWVATKSKNLDGCIFYIDDVSLQ